ncbi:MAG: elongation factor 1-beta [Candidatus Bathyarchaeota archaeon]|nr:MAG: elongation factor 1-beta [Candidatus Bathyarchaeota archaeon]
MPKVRVFGAMKMADVVISYKILPQEVDVDFDELLQQIIQNLPEKVEVFTDYQTEPIAFGLNAMIAHIKIPEDETGLLDEMEQRIENLPSVSRIQTLMVRRVS